MFRKKFKNCKVSTHENRKGRWCCIIESPHNPIVSIVAMEDTKTQAIIVCQQKWKAHFGVTNRKKILLHIPKTNKKE
jgi:hypothetical protein